MHGVYCDYFGRKFYRVGNFPVMLAKDDQDLGSRGNRFHRCRVGKSGIIMNKRKTIMKIPLFFCELGDAPVDINHLTDIMAVRVSDFDIRSRRPVPGDHGSNSLLPELTGEV